MTVAACPNSETLAAFARGDLGATELAGVAEHVGGCEACCRALKLMPEDSLAGLARAAAAAHTTMHSGMTPAPTAPASNSAPAGVPEALANHPRYRIISELGRGGMGTVYKAEDTWMARTIALKVVSPHLTAKASALTRFKKEVRAAAQLQHQNIVMAHDTGEAGGAQFLVMEYIEGVSLDRLVAKKGPLPVPMACMFIRQAALGLQHAATKGMVHRDIKPQNLLVTRKGQVKILDFGLARFASTDDEGEGTGEDAPTQKLSFGAGNKPPSNAGVTNPNLLMGTPDYLSPEQAKNSHDVDPRSDIYSLGCTLYFLLTGKPPFSGASTLIDKLLAHTHEEPPPIRLERMEVSEEVAGVLAKMMAKNPDDRYESAAEAAAALLPLTRADAKEHGFEVVEVIAVTPGPPPQVVAMPVVTPAPVSPLVFDTAPVQNGPTVAELVKPRKKKKKRLPWWKEHKWPILGAVALFTLIAAAIALTKKRPTDDKPTDPTAGASAKANPSPATKGDKADKGNAPVAIAPPKTSGLKVLYVLPSTGVWLDDFVPVRDRLKEQGVTVVTASTDGGTSRPHSDAPGESVPIDVRFSATMSLSEYDAVVFCGYNSDEYVFLNKGSVAAAKVIQRMQNEGKTVAAICVGQGVLVAHGVLRNRKAADSEWVKKKFPLITNERSGIDWQSQGVVTDGKIVTASNSDQARPFADAVIAAIRGK